MSGIVVGAIAQLLIGAFVGAAVLGVGESVENSPRHFDRVLEPVKARPASRRDSDRPPPAQSVAP